jgi:DNA repair photolyase
MDILNDIKEVAILPNELIDKLDNGVIISFSFSTLNEQLAKIIEPGAPSPAERLETMKKFSNAGFKTGIINMPTLPFLSDSEIEIEKMAMNAKMYGAHYILHAGLTLYGDTQDDCKALYFNLKENYPDLLPKYEKLFKGSIAYPKHYQNDLNIKFSEISSR